jgi:hypothetical protein
MMIVFAFTLALASPAGAHQLKPSKPVAKMSLDEIEQFQVQALRHYTGAVRWWVKHPARKALRTGRSTQLFSATTKLVPYCKTLGIRAPQEICWHGHAADWTRPLLAKTRAKQERLLTYTGDWYTAVRIVQRVWPGTEGWLRSCSASEGGSGAFVMNRQGSGAGGWLQFMSGTFYGHIGAAVAEARSRGFDIPVMARSWGSPLGQAATGAYMYSHGMSYHWVGAGC